METENINLNTDIPPAPGIKRSGMGSAATLTLITIIMLWLSQEPTGWSFLSWFAIVPWVVATTRCEKYLKMGALNWFCGSLYFLISLLWLWDITGPGMIALSIYLGLYFVISGFILRRVYVARRRWWFTICLPIVWVGQEYLRGTVMTGLPWLFLSHNLIDYQLAQVAEITGAYGITFLAAMVNGLFCDGLLRPLFDTNPHTGQKRAAGLFRLLLVGIIISGAHLFGTIRGNNVANNSIPGPVVSVIQDTIPQSNKDSAGNFDDMFDSHIKLSEQAAEDDVKENLIIWPETIVPAHINQEFLDLKNKYDLLTDNLKVNVDAGLEFNKRLMKLANDADAELLVGTPGMILRLSDINSEVVIDRTNSAIMYDSNGNRFPKRYDKMHLVPFGEYVPFKESIPWLNKLLLSLTPYEYDYSLLAGKMPVRFEVQQPIEETENQPAAAKKYGFAVAICYEDVIPQTARLLSNYEGVDFLVNISNDGWYVKTHELQCGGGIIEITPTSELMQHWNISRYRAIENRIGIARSVNCGISGFIKPDGSAQTNSTGTLSPEPRDRRCEVGYLTDHVWIYNGGRTIYAAIGDTFAITCTILMGIVFVITLKRSRK